MSGLTVRTEIDARALLDMLRAAGSKAPKGIARALNRAGVPTENAYLRTVKRVLGVRSHPYAKRPVGNFIKRRTSRKRANSGHLVYSLAGFGKGLPAIYYQPKEAAKGASINWLGTRKTIARSFYLSGRFPRRRRSSISNVVWERTGKGRWALSRPTGPGLPDAMAASPSVSVWESQAAARVGPALVSALQAILRGY